MSQTKMGGLLLRVALLAALSLVLPCLVEGGRAGEPWTVTENREKLQPAAILASQAVKERGGRDETNGGAPLSDGGSLEDSPGKRFADWYKKNTKISIPVTVAVAAAILIVLVVVVCLCRWCIKRRAVKSKGYVRIQYGQPGSSSYYTSNAPDNDAAVTRSGGGLVPPRERGVGEAMNFEKQKLEKTERERAELAVKFFLRSNPHYKWEGSLPDMGSRLKKFWFLVSTSQGADFSGSRRMLLTIAPVPKQCPIKLPNSENTLNELYASLKHPFLHQIREVRYLQDRNSLVTIQSYLPKGTLKDYIYRSKPDIDWSGKYSRRSRGMRSDRVALFGRQILEALVFLYKKGFPPLGHVQSGNVFVEGEVCHLGAYDITLLGYKTRLYSKIKEQGVLVSIDTVMFGHLLFEMACGYELIALAPSNEDYTAVKDSDIHEVLVFIFSDSPNSFPTIEWVLEQSFFQQPVLPQLHQWDAHSVVLSPEAEGLLRLVAKGKPVPPPSSSSSPRTESTKPVPAPRRGKHEASTGQTAPAVAVTPVTEQPSSPSQRQDLLADIRKGTPLKSSETSDRSSPHM